MTTPSSAPLDETKKMEMALEIHKKHPHLHAAAFADLTVGDIVVGEARMSKANRKNVPINPKVNKGNRASVTVVLNGPAMIHAEYGVSKNQEGTKTYVSIPVTDAREQNGCKAIDDHFIRIGTESLLMWPERAAQNRKPPSKDEIYEKMGTEECPYTFFMKPGYTTVKGTKVLPQIKASVDVDPVTGALGPKTVITNLKGEPVPLETLPGRIAYQRTYEIQYHYFAPPRWGPVKVLTRLKVSNEIPEVMNDATYDELSKLIPMDAEPPVEVAPVPQETVMIPVDPVPTKEAAPTKEDVAAVPPEDNIMDMLSAPATEPKSKKQRHNK